MIARTPPKRRCVKCGRGLPEHFAFCALCGADNRHPDERVVIRSCSHPNNLQASHYCIHCGEDLLKHHGLWISHDSKLAAYKYGFVVCLVLTAILFIGGLIKVSSTALGISVVLAIATAILLKLMLQTKEIADEEALPPGWHDAHKSNDARNESKARR